MKPLSTDMETEEGLLKSTCDSRDKPAISQTGADSLLEEVSGKSLPAVDAIQELQT